MRFTPNLTDFTSGCKTPIARGRGAFNGFNGFNTFSLECKCYTACGLKGVCPTHTNTHQRNRVKSVKSVFTPIPSADYRLTSRCKTGVNHPPYRCKMGVAGA